MATLTIAGRSFEIAPYKLGALRKAAPHIDAINVSVKAAEKAAKAAKEAGKTTDTTTDVSIAGLFENTEHIVAIVAIGLGKIDPAMTADALEDVIGIEDMPALGTALRDILAEAGLAPTGEATAPAPKRRKAAGAS